MNDFPKKIPVFPLSNFIIFPKTTVPLNIFEPRYIDMVNDSMKTNKMIGMIQPKSNNDQKNKPIKQNTCLPCDADHGPSKSDAGSGRRSGSS